MNFLKQIFYADTASSLLKYCEDGRFDQARNAIQASDAKFVATRTSTEATPLHVTCHYFNDMSLVQTLVSVGADVNAVDMEGRSPLHVACERGTYNMVSYLMNVGANRELRTKRNRTPLHCAVSSNNNDAVNALLERRVSVEAKDSQLCTALHIACFNGYADIALQLINNDADINALDISRETPLFKACRNNRENIVMLLLLRGADKSVVNVSNQTAGQVTSNRDIAFAFKAASNSVVDVLRQQVRTLDSELNELRAKYEQDIEKMVEQVSLQESVIQQAAVERDHYNQQLMEETQSLRDQLTDALQNVAAVSEKNNELQCEVDTLQKSCEDAKHEVDAVITTVTQSNERVRELQYELDLVTAQLERSKLQMLTVRSLHRNEPDQLKQLLPGMRFLIDSLSRTIRQTVADDWSMLGPQFDTMTPAHLLSSANVIKRDSFGCFYRLPASALLPSNSDSNTGSLIIREVIVTKYGMDSIDRPVNLGDLKADIMLLSCLSSIGYFVRLFGYYLQCDVKSESIYLIFDDPFNTLSSTETSNHTTLGFAPSRPMIGLASSFADLLTEHQITTPVQPFTETSEHRFLPLHLFLSKHTGLEGIIVKLQLAMQVSEALQIVHEIGLAYRDMETNVVVSLQQHDSNQANDGLEPNANPTPVEVRLLDVGLARLPIGYSFTDSVSTNQHIEAESWSAPQHEGVTIAANIYSFGFLVWSLLFDSFSKSTNAATNSTASTSIESDSETQLPKHIPTLDNLLAAENDTDNGSFFVHLLHQDREVAERLYFTVVDLIHSCWRTVPEQRPNISSVRQQLSSLFGILSHNKSSQDTADM